MSFTSESRWSDVAIATAARAISSCGDFLAATALVLALQQRGAGSYAVAALLLAAAVPPVVLVRLTGRLADRVDSRLLLVATGIGQTVACLAMAYASNAYLLIGLATLLACGYAQTQPVLAALLPAMVRREDLARASALGQTASSIGLLIAPALAGVLVGQFGLRVPLLCDAASYLAIVVGGLVIRTRRATGPGRGAPSDASSQTGRSGAASGRAARGPAANAVGGPTPTRWRLRDDRLLWNMVALLGALVAAISAVNVADVFFLRDVLHASTTVYGLVSAVWTGAMMVGAVLLGRGRISDAGLAVTMAGSLLLTSLDVLGISAVPNVGVVVPLMAIGGLTNGAENVVASVLLGRRTPADFRGRAFALFSAVANGANALGFVAGGIVLGVLPVRLTIAASGLFGLVVTVIFAVPLLRVAARERAGGGPTGLPAGAPVDVPA